MSRFTKVFKCETLVCLALYRTHVYDESDLDEARKITKKYEVYPLNRYTLNEDWIKNSQKPYRKFSKDKDYRSYFNYLLTFCPFIGFEENLRK